MVNNDVIETRQKFAVLIWFIVFVCIRISNYYILFKAGKYYCIFISKLCNKIAMLLLSLVTDILVAKIKHFDKPNLDKSSY